LINNKIYIFGGQGDGDIIFDDLHSCEILEETDPKSGDLVYVAQWTVIEPQTPSGAPRPLNKPRARTSHSCTVYKNRYMIIIGGEGQFDEAELRIKENNTTTLAATASKSKKGKKKGKNDSADITVEIDPNEDSDTVSSSY